LKKTEQEMKHDDKFRVERDRLYLTSGRPGQAVLGRLDGTIVFGPLFPRLEARELSGKAYNPSGSIVEGFRTEEADMNSPAGGGPGLRMTLAGGDGLPLRLVWELCLVGGEDCAVRLLVLNTGPVSLKLFEVIPVSYRGADPGLAMGAGYSSWRFYRTGYQSWSPAGSVSIMGRECKPGFFLPARSSVNPRTPYSKKPGEKVADWMAQVVEPNLSLSALLGFVTSASMNGRVEFEVRYDRFRRLEAVCDCEGRLLDPGEELSSEWCVASLSSDPLWQQARFFDMWGRAMKARKSPPRSGWCSWYFAFDKVSEGLVRKNVDRIKEHGPGVEVVQIDDGFEEWVGEWTRWGGRFTSGPDVLAKKIEEAGARPGLWLAPFLVSRQAPLFSRRPEWIIRTDKGRPVIAFLHPSWKGHVIHALDPTNPGVQDWLKETVRQIVHGFGYSYLKLDFLYAGALPGKRYDPRATGASALRRGLEVIREAAGDEAYILGCGCPLGPAIGLVDAMRVSPDVDPKWKRPLLDALWGVPSVPGTENCLRNDAARMLMHGRLWSNDPDCALVRRGPMSDDQVRSELTMLYLSGGAAFLSEDLSRLPPERRGWFARMVPPSNVHAWPLDLLERRFPASFLLKQKEHSALVALFNWSGERRIMELDLARLGLPGSWHVFDFWAGKYAGAAVGRSDLGWVPPYGVKYLRLVRADGKPRLLATDLHMGMGETGVEEEPGEDGIELEITLPGERRGSIWAVLPRGKLKSVQVEFTDKWEGRV